MNKMAKRLIAVALCLSLVVAFTACGGSDKTYKVGICQLVQHDALDAATKGFKDVLEEEFGDNVEFDEQNAQGDSNTCATIMNQFASDKVDLILANATASLQAGVAATDSIPILGTSITDYGTALSLKNFDSSKALGTNVSGTTDLAPLDKQAEMFKELLPDAKTIGLLYCSAEANSKYQVDTIKGYLEDEGYKTKMFSFSDSNDISSVVTKATKSVDALYIPTDNTCASNTEIINNICLPAKCPIIAGEEGIASGCGIATLSISYEDLGRKTGEMAVKILKGDSDIKEMPIESADATTKKYNKSICKKLGISVPDDYEAIATE